MATPLEKLGFPRPFKETLTIQRQTRAMPVYRFVLAMCWLARWDFPGSTIGVSSRGSRCSPALTGDPVTPAIDLLALSGLPAPTAGAAARGAAAPSARAGLGNGPCPAGGGDPGHRHAGAHRSPPAQGRALDYNPKHKGKKSDPPILTFLAGTQDYVARTLRRGDQPDGRGFAEHFRSVAAGLPPGVETVFARANAGSYYSVAGEAYQSQNR